MNNYWLLLEHVAACELCLFFSSIKSYTVDEINWTWFSLLSWDDMSNCVSCAALASEWEQLIAICIEKKPHNQDKYNISFKIEFQIWKNIFVSQFFVRWLLHSRLVHFFFCLAFLSFSFFAPFVNWIPRIRNLLPILFFSKEGERTRDL